MISEKSGYSCFSGKEVRKTNGYWTQKDIQEAKKLTQCDVQKLELYGNRMVNLVKEISHIRFTALFELWISQNNIESLEEISRIYMPSLSEFLFSKNNVSSIRVLRKAQLPSLRVLSMYHNYFSDADSLDQANFPILNNLNVTWSASGDDKNDLGDSFLSFKLETTYLKSLCFQSKKFSKKRSVTRALLCKWKDVSIT